MKQTVQFLSDFCGWYVDFLGAWSPTHVSLLYESHELSVWVMKAKETLTSLTKRNQSLHSSSSSSLYQELCVLLFPISKQEEDSLEKGQLEEVSFVILDYHFNFSLYSCFHHQFLHFQQVYRLAKAETVKLELGKDFVLKILQQKLVFSSLGN